MIPAFSSPVDCTPWVIGGLWPAELSTVTAETAMVAEYLKADLQRIANSANEELNNIRRAGMADAARRAKEARVINAARAFAVRRIESTVRHLGEVVSEVPVEYGRPNGIEEIGEAVSVDKPQRLTEVTALHPAVEPRPDDNPPKQSPKDAEGRGHEAMRVERYEEPVEPIGPVPQSASVAEPEALDPGGSGTIYPAGPYTTDALETAETDPHAQLPVDDAAAASLLTRHAEVPADGAASAGHAEAPVDTESERERLQRLLEFVARQEPRMHWAVGDREDGTTVLVTDLAHGWIPPGITLPAGVRLLEPQRCSGNTAALLGNVTVGASYAPGDPLGWATDFVATESSLQPRELPAVDDLEWALGEATHQRDDLPRMVHTLAKAGAAGTGVGVAEIDLLRVYLETAHYQLLAQYPDVDAALLRNCLLLAATEGMATGDRLSANYHFAWFQALSAPPVSRWAVNP